MKKIIFPLLLMTVSIQLFSQNEDIQVFHGRNKTTSFIYKNKGKRIVKSSGEEVSVVILNPNQLFYTYEFKVNEVDITEDIPDVSALVKILTPLFESSGSAVATSLKIKADLPGKVAFKADEDPLGKYKEGLNDLQADISQVTVLIRNSDIPENRADAVNRGARTAGLEYAQARISAISFDKGRFNSPTLLSDLDAYVDAIKGEDDLLIKSFKAYNRSIVEGISGLKKKIMNLQDQISFSIPSGDKQKRVQLIIKKIPGVTDPQIRDEIDEEFVVVESEFKRKNLEIIPVANLTYASNTFDFSLKNGIVTKEPADGWKFRGGAMLIAYPVKFGVYKEWAIGTGLGFNIPKDNSVLENFYAGANLSYKNIFRVGLGWGFSEYPYSLKYDVKEGSALPSNIGKIEDIVTYNKRSSIFITFSISGIPLL